MHFNCLICGKACEDNSLQDGLCKYHYAAWIESYEVKRAASAVKTAFSDFVRRIQCEDLHHKDS